MPKEPYYDVQNPIIPETLKRTSIHLDCNEPDSGFLHQQITEIATPLAPIINKVVSTQEAALRKAGVEGINVVTYADKYEDPIKKTVIKPDDTQIRELMTNGEMNVGAEKVIMQAIAAQLKAAGVQGTISIQDQYSQYTNSPSQIVITTGTLKPVGYCR